MNAEPSAVAKAFKSLDGEDKSVQEGSISQGRACNSSSSAAAAPQEFPDSEDEIADVPQEFPDDDVLMGMDGFD